MCLFNMYIYQKKDYQLKGAEMTFFIMYKQSSNMQW